MQHVGVKTKISNPTLFKNGFSLGREEISRIATSSLDAVKKILQPLQRSGDLDKSWNIIANSTSFSLWSSDWAASSMQTGFAQAPPKDILLDWMKLKSEFSGMDEKEMERVGYAIRLSILRGDSPGPTSTIGGLDPVGVRSFNYMKVAEKEIMSIIKRRILNI